MLFANPILMSIAVFATLTILVASILITSFNAVKKLLMKEAGPSSCCDKGISSRTSTSLFWDCVGDDENGETTTTRSKLNINRNSEGTTSTRTNTTEPNTFSKRQPEDDSEDYIGGSPTSLPPLRGPTQTTLSFRVYAPPPLDKEIPKLDLAGALVFVRTGKVRTTYVPLGAKRLLVIDLRELTVALYTPKLNCHKSPKPNAPKHQNAKNFQGKVLERETKCTPIYNADKEREVLFGRKSTATGAVTTADEIRTNLTPRISKLLGSKSVGIHISKRKSFTTAGYLEEDEEEVDMEDEEKEWDPQNFELVPAYRRKLNEIVSVSSLPPRHGGVLEIIYQMFDSSGENKSGCGSSSPNASNDKKSGDSKKEDSNSMDSVNYGRKSIINIEQHSPSLTLNPRTSTIAKSAEELEMQESFSNELEQWWGGPDPEMAARMAPNSGESNAAIAAVTSTYNLEDDDGRFDFPEPSVANNESLVAIAPDLVRHVAKNATIRQTSSLHHSLPRVPSISPPALHEMKAPFESINTFVPASNGKKNKKKSQLLVVRSSNEANQEIHRDEFVFLNPRDAAEFQRMVLLLRFCGRELLHMYEVLESVQATSEAYFPEALERTEQMKLLEESGDPGDMAIKKNHHAGKLTGGKSFQMPFFSAAGVALDDAWRCFNDIPVLYQGLCQFYHSLRVKRGREDDMIAAAAAGEHISNEAEIGDSTAEKESPEKEIDSNEEMRQKKEIAFHYKEHRALLGVVDFYSLFVPPLPDDSPALPYFTPCAVSERENPFNLTNSAAIDVHYQQLRTAAALQQRVGKAALYTRAFALAKLVVRDGWQLRHIQPKFDETKVCDAEIPDTARTLNNSSVGTESDKTKVAEIKENEGNEKKTFNQIGSNHNEISTRLAYDSDRDNWVHDIHALDEYYEATIGRDLTAKVNVTPNTLDSKGRSVPHIANSLYQGYSLVACHTFEIPTADSEESFWIRLDGDPVASIPSLRRTVDKFPDSHFFIFCVINEESKKSSYFLFVRSLPVGVDSGFDNVVNNFISSNAEVRDKKVKIVCQFGFGNNWSSFMKGIMRGLLMTLYHWWVKGNITFPFSTFGVGSNGKREKMSFPGFQATNIFRLRHFGGSMQKNEDLPKNYIAVTMRMSLNNISSWLGRVLFRFARVSVLENSVMDMTYVLKAHSEDEYPERALGTTRLVHVELERIAIPLTYSEIQENIQNNVTADDSNDLVDNPSPSSGNSGGFFPKLYRFINGEKRRERGTIPDLTAEPSQTPNIVENELYSNKINSLQEILEGVTVPFRTPVNTLRYGNQFAVEKLVLDCVNRSDIERYLIACENDLKSAAVRIVESVAWRGSTFPVDLRSCRVELQSGQFFQQGSDKEGNPIFYFRNVLLGPWRNDTNASTLAVLHRLESFFEKVSASRNCVKITVVILMGCPIENEKRNAILRGANPRIDQNESYSVHSNYQYVRSLCGILSTHFPERLAKALVVPSGSWMKILGSRGLKDYVSSPVTRSRVTIVTSLDDLKKFIDEKELVTFAGGKSKVSKEAFQCGTFLANVW